MRRHAYAVAPLVFAISALSISPAFGQAFSTPPPSQAAETFASVSPASPTGVLTLRAAVDLALAQSPDIAVATREYEASEGAIIQGRARPNPTASYLQEDMQRQFRTTTVQLNQPIELGGKRQARVDAAERGRDAAGAELVSRRNEVRALAMGLFFDVLTAQERLRLAQDSVDLARRARDATAKRVTAGRISPVEETKARVAEAGAQVEFLQAQSELATTRQRLAGLWGIGMARFERADGQVDALPIVPTVNDLEGRLTRSPNLKRAETEVERRKAMTALERAKRIPDVTLSVGAKRVEDIDRTQLVIGIAIPIPILDTNRGNIYEAAKREDKARDELIATRVRLNTDVLQARERLASARAELEVLQSTVLPGAQSAYDAATTGFQLGKFQFLDVLDAQRTLFQAKSQYLRALSEAHRASAEIDRILGDQSADQEKKS